MKRGGPKKNQKVTLPPLPTAATSEEALERKNRTVAALQELKIPTLETLSSEKDSTTARLRTKEEVAARILVLQRINGLGLSSPQELEELGDTLLRQLATFEVKKYASAKEIALLKLGPKISPEDANLCCWVAEDLWVLFWCLNIVDSLEIPYMAQQCNLGEIEGIGRAWFQNTPEAFLGVLKEKFEEKNPKAGELRSLDEILDQFDLVFRCHWAARNDWIAQMQPGAAKSSQETMQAAIIRMGICEEWHKTLKWVLSANVDWDMIQTST